MDLLSVLYAFVWRLILNLIPLGVSVRTVYSGAVIALGVAAFAAFAGALGVFTYRRIHGRAPRPWMAAIYSVILGATYLMQMEAASIRPSWTVASVVGGLLGFGFAARYVASRTPAVEASSGVSLPSVSIM